MHGVLLCSSVSRALKEASWLGSCSVIQCIRHLMSQTLLFSCWCWCVGREAMVTAPPPMRDSAVSPCFHGCLALLHRHSHHNLLPHILSIHLSTVDRSPHPGIAPKSLNSSSQPLCLPGDLCPCPGYVWLQQGLSGSHSI